MDAELEQACAHANAFWEKIPYYTPSALAEAQKIATDGLRLRRDTLQYLHQQGQANPKSTELAMASNTNRLHEVMLNQDQLTSAAGLMQDVRKLCKYVVFNGSIDDPINWPQFGVVWQSIFDNPEWDDLQELAERVKSKLPPEELLKLEKRWAEEFGPEVPVERAKSEEAIDELSHRICNYVLDPNRDSQVDFTPIAERLCRELADYLVVKYSDAAMPDKDFEIVSKDALNFLAAKLPEQFVSRLLKPQMQIIESVIAETTLQQATLLGKLLPPANRIKSGN